MATGGCEFYPLVLKVSLTRSLRSLVRDTFQHSKIKFVSLHSHVISSVYYISTNEIPGELSCENMISSQVM